MGGCQRRSVGPGTDPADVLDGDPHADAWGWLVDRWELHVRAEVHMRELLKQLRRPAILDRCPPAHHEILAQARRTERIPLERERHARGRTAKGQQATPTRGVCPGPGTTRSRLLAHV